MEKEDRKSAIDRLKEIQEEIRGLIAEAEDTLRGLDYTEHQIDQNYWTPLINNVLDGSVSITGMGETIKALEDA